MSLMPWSFTTTSKWTRTSTSPKPTTTFTSTKRPTTMSKTSTTSTSSRSSRSSRTTTSRPRDQFEDRGGLEQLEEPDLHEELREYPDYGYQGDADIDTVPSPMARTQTFVIDRSHPYESPGRSARNHWQLITVFCLLGVLLGAAFAFVRPPTYTAEPRLVVGKTAQLSNLASVPGLDAAGESLASSYSRLVSTDEVLAARPSSSAVPSTAACPVRRFPTRPSCVSRPPRRAAKARSSSPGPAPPRSWPRSTS